MNPDTILFVNPETGEYFNVLAARHTVNAAIKLGYMPANSAADEQVDKVLGNES